MLEHLQADRSALAQLLTARRAVSVETLPAGARLLWGAYLVLLEDALRILSSMIDFLERK